MANLDFFGVFDFQTNDDDTYKYTATEFVKLYKAMTANGVVKGEAEEMAVELNGLTASVKTGSAFVQGRYGEITTAKNLTLTTSGVARIDRIVLKVDIPNRTFSVEVKQGGAAAPTLTQNATVWEISLAKINVPASGVSTTMVDERTFFYKPTQVMDKMNAITGGTEYVYAVYA